MQETPKLINSKDLERIFSETTREWHKSLPQEKQVTVDFIKAIHFYNFRLWHLEDEARRRDVSDSYIASIKRDIDRNNQARNDSIERIDQYIVESLKERVNPSPQAPLNSETPGSIIDRLSILSLKIYHMGKEGKRKGVSPSYREECWRKLKILKEQRKDLSRCLDDLMEDLLSGKKRLKVYHQFKMYNDPRSNPALYQHGKEE